MQRNNIYSHKDSNTRQLQANLKTPTPNDSKTKIKLTLAFFHFPMMESKF